MLKIFLTICLAVFIVGVCFIFFNRSSYVWFLNQARRRGIYPSLDKSSLEDVKKLLHSGEKLLAVRLYSQMYRLSIKQAALEVDLLERNLGKNNTSKP